LSQITLPLVGTLFRRPRNGQTAWWESIALKGNYSLQIHKPQFGFNAYRRSSR